MIPTPGATAAEAMRAGGSRYCSSKSCPIPPRAERKLVISNQACGECHHRHTSRSPGDASRRARFMLRDSQRFERLLRLLVLRATRRIDAMHGAAMEREQCSHTPAGRSPLRSHSFVPHAVPTPTHSCSTEQPAYAPDASASANCGSGTPSVFARSDKAL